MYLQLFVIALILYLVLDIIWIRFAAKRLYNESIGYITKSHPNLIVGGLIYPLIVAGLTFFVIEPSFTGLSPFNGAIIGAFFGLVTYGSYDLTNLATVKEWPSSITVIDIIWGMTLCATVTAATYFIASMIVV